MWDAVKADFTSFIRVDFNWMTLLFTIFAVSSGCQTEEESRKYYLQALTGKRLAEDVLSASFVNPRPGGLCPQGTALACMAAGLLAQYLLERGQMTEVSVFENARFSLFIYRTRRSIRSVCASSTISGYVASEVLVTLTNSMCVSRPGSSSEMP